MKFSPRKQTFFNWFFFARSSPPGVCVGRGVGARREDKLLLATLIFSCSVTVMCKVVSGRYRPLICVTYRLSFSFFTLRRPRKFEDILTLDKVFGENLRGSLKISVKGKARQVILRFRKAFTVGCNFRERRKTALKNSRGSNHS